MATSLTDCERSGTELLRPLGRVRVRIRIRIRVRVRVRVREQNCYDLLVRANPLRETLIEAYPYL